ncbi:MAG: N-acetylmuramoyl-L-alanine amidase [Rhodospirillales bacterium]|nr:N-acetylmuramoyl-L-alanine amidase [Rhodospirillales bacterium]
MLRVCFHCFLLIVMAGAPALAKPTVEAPRSGTHADFLRVVLDLSEALPYRIFTLPNPPRLVVDLPEVGFKFPVSKNLKMPQVKALRSGLFAPGLSRLVFDLEGPVKVLRAAVLPPNDRGLHRLYFDIAPTDNKSFASKEARKALTSKKPLPKAVYASAVPSIPIADRRPLIVIDAGHGGPDPGAISVSGAYEKDITLAFAKILADTLRRSNKYRVLMTRDRDIFLPLAERYAVAERADADLFISLHANIHAKSSIKGASVFTLSERGADSDADAAALAAKENGADAVAGAASVDQVAHILGDLMRRETMNLSKNYANRLVGELAKETVLLRNTHRYAGFRVLKSPVVPSVLLEIGYLSNRTEERLLHQKKHRQKISKAILRALDSFFLWQEAVNRS